MKARPTAEKRRKELERQERQRAKAERRQQARQQRAERASADPDEPTLESPDAPPTDGSPHAAADRSERPLERPEPHGEQASSGPNVDSQSQRKMDFAFRRSLGRADQPDVGVPLASGASGAEE